MHVVVACLSDRFIECAKGLEARRVRLGKLIKHEGQSCIVADSILILAQIGLPAEQAQPKRLQSKTDSIETYCIRQRCISPYPQFITIVAAFRVGKRAQG